jgi:hypothetical protein
MPLWYFFLIFLALGLKTSALVVAADDFLTPLLPGSKKRSTTRGFSAQLDQWVKNSRQQKWKYRHSFVRQQHLRTYLTLSSRTLTSKTSEARWYCQTSPLRLVRWRRTSKGWRSQLFVLPKFWSETSCGPTGGFHAYKVWANLMHAIFRHFEISWVKFKSFYI